MRTLVRRVHGVTVAPLEGVRDDMAGGVQVQVHAGAPIDHRARSARAGQRLQEGPVAIVGFWLGLRHGRARRLRASRRSFFSLSASADTGRASVRDRDCPPGKGVDTNVVVAPEAVGDLEYQPALAEAPRRGDVQPVGTSRFLNVDLEVEASEDLTPVATALEASRKVVCLHVGPNEAGYRASFELVRDPGTPDLAVLDLVEAVRSLPASTRRQMRRADRLDLSVGIQAGADPERLELALSPASLRAAASIGARITICVYPPERMAATRCDPDR